MAIWGVHIEFSGLVVLSRPIVGGYIEKYPAKKLTQAHHMTLDCWKPSRTSVRSDEF